MADLGPTKRMNLINEQNFAKRFLRPSLPYHAKKPEDRDPLKTESPRAARGRGGHPK